MKRKANIALAVVMALLGVAGLFSNAVSLRNWMPWLAFAMVMILAAVADLPKRAEMRKREWLDLADTLDKPTVKPVAEPSANSEQFKAVPSTSSTRSSRPGNTMKLHRVT